MQRKEYLIYKPSSLDGPVREMKAKYFLLFKGPGKRGLTAIFNTYGHSVDPESECWERFKAKYPE